MKDRNGKELQKGDVCLVHVAENSNKVFWQGVSAKAGDIVEYLEMSGPCPLTDAFVKGQGHMVDWIKNEHIEIIGSVRDE